MSQEHENLLEVDHLEEVLDEPGPPQPVVVVQYRSRAAAWLAIVSVVVAVALGSLLFYHFREVERLRVQAQEARLELRRLTAMNPEENRAATPAVGPPAMAAKDPHASDGAITQPVAVPVATAPSATTPAPASPDAAKPTEPAKADPAMSLAQLPAKADPAPATKPVPAAPTASSPPAPAPAATPPASSIIAAQGCRLRLTVRGRSRGERKRPGRRSGGAAVPGASRPQDGDVSPAKPVGPVAAVEPPLPSKEETERQIREEAARKQAEADHRVAQQEEDLQTLRDDDRSRFREDLRMVLQEYGKQAGKEIEELSVRPAAMMTR